MTSATRSLTPHRRRLAGAAASAVVCLVIVGCGGPAEPAVAPPATASPAVSATTPDPTPSAHAADQVVVDIRIADGKVSPNGEKVDVAVGQEVVLNVTSDADDEIHAHTDDATGYELEVKAGEPATGRFAVASAGSFEVESHHLEKIIVILNVR